MRSGVVLQRSGRRVPARHIDYLVKLGATMLWGMDKATVTDLSGNGRGGTPTGGATAGNTSGDSPLRSFLASTTITVNTQRINSTYTVPWGSPAMVVMWLKPGGWGASQTLMRCPTLANAPQIISGAAGSLLFRAIGGGATASADISGSLPPAGVWSMLAVGFDDPNNLVYHSLNGAPRSTVAMTDAAAVAGPIGFGAATLAYLGQFGPCAVFERLLTDAELAQAYSMTR